MCKEYDSHTGNTRETVMRQFALHHAMHQTDLFASLCII